LRATPRRLITYGPQRTDRLAINGRDCLNRLIKQVSGFGKVFFILGNHEHYKGFFENTRQIFEDYLFRTLELDPSRYYLLDREPYIGLGRSQNIIIAGTTLWTDMGRNNPISHNAVGQGMNDFHVIYKDDGESHYATDQPTFTTHDAVREHKYSVNWIGDLADQYPNQRIIVATHHCPTYKSNGREHAHSTIIDGYCSDLSELILTHPNITDWVHGHTHVNCDYEVGKCRVQSFQRGYVKYDRGANDFTADNFLKKFIAI
jgi:hypothetical protein